MKISQTLPDIDFNRIRHHGGTRHGGFEQLVVGIFRHEFGSTSEIIRVNGVGGDGGVEAYTEHENGEVTGLQVKFFERLGPPQFRQIKESIRAARENHPALKRRRWTSAAPAGFLAERGGEGLPDCRGTGLFH